MSIDLSTVFGSAINVVVQPRDSERTYSGFPGAHGVTTMFLGTRGRMIQVTGRIACSGANYAAARTNCQIAIDAIEAYLWAAAADYSWGTCVYYAVVWDSFRLVGDANGKFFRWTMPGYCIVDFIASGRAIL
jgi:hypothetical protein